MPRGNRVYKEAQYIDAILTVLMKEDGLTAKEIAERIKENGHIVSNQEFNSLKDTVHNYLTQYTSDNENNKHNLPKGHVNDIFKCDIINKKNQKWSIKNPEQLPSVINQNANELKKLNDKSHQ